MQMYFDHTMFSNHLRQNINCNIINFICYTWTKNDHQRSQQMDAIWKRRNDLHSILCGIMTDFYVCHVVKICPNPYRSMQWRYIKMRHEKNLSLSDLGHHGRIIPSFSLDLAALVLNKQEHSNKKWLRFFFLRFYVGKLIWLSVCCWCCWWLWYVFDRLQIGNAKRINVKEMMHLLILSSFFPALQLHQMLFIWY